MSSTYSTSETFSVADVENVMRRVTADLVMIASSTGAVTEDRARDWAHDIEILAKGRYLSMVDLTLLSSGIEVRATRFTVNTESGALTTSRPGGVMWPRYLNPALRIVLYYTGAYDDAARAATSPKLSISWGPTSADTSHSGLTGATGRDYVSNGYGMQRKDFN
jgi:hypothetical protein